MATLIDTDGLLRIVKPANGKAFTLKELQGYVAGCIEIVECHTYVVVVNEEGKLRGFPFNAIATHITRGVLASDDAIVGNALLCLHEEIDLVDEEDEEMLTRAEHIAWCKARALGYVEQGELNLAFASMASDLSKHAATVDHPAIRIGARLMFEGRLNNAEAMRRYIDAFS